MRLFNSGNFQRFSRACFPIFHGGIANSYRCEHFMPFRHLGHLPDRFKAFCCYGMETNPACCQPNRLAEKINVIACDSRIQIATRSSCLCMDNNYGGCASKDGIIPLIIGLHDPCSPFPHIFELSFTRKHFHNAANETRIERLF